MNWTRSLLIGLRYSLLLLGVSLFSFHCSGGTEKNFQLPQTGVTVVVLGSQYYRITSVGRALQEAIDDEDRPRMERTACQAAKDMVYAKIDELEPKEKLRRMFLETENSFLLQEGEYCKLIYLYEGSAQKGKKP